MVVDSSALLAILFSETKRNDFVAAIDGDPIRLLSTASFVECSIVVAARRGAEGVRDLDHLIARAAIRLELVDDEQAYLARAAWERFGKGRHAAALNFGDCFAYALAHVTNEPLLFAGQDLSQTDVPAHPASG